MTQRLHRGPLPLLTPTCTFSHLHLPLRELVEPTEWARRGTRPPSPFSHHPEGLHGAGTTTGQRATSRLPPPMRLLLVSFFGGILPAVSWWPHGANALSHCCRSTGDTLVTTEGDHRAGKPGLSRKQFPFECLSRGCSSYTSRVPSALPKLLEGWLF